MKRNGGSNRIILWTVLGSSFMIAIASIAMLVYEIRETYTVRLASGGTTGEYYSVAQAIAQVTAENYPKIRIEVLESPGSTQNMADVHNQVVDLALVQSNTPVQRDVRAIAQLYPEMLHLMVNKSAGINTMADLKGKRIALMPKGSGSHSLFWPVSEHYGLDPRDFTSTLMPATEATEALLNNRVDAVFRIIGIGNSEISRVLKTGQFDIVPFEQIKALQLTQPYLQSTLIPTGTYDGGLPSPDRDLSTISVSALLVAHKDVENEVIRAITQVLYDHRNELIQKNPLLANIQPPETMRNLGFRIHPDTLAYHAQNDPSFLERYAELLGLLLSVAILAVSGLWQLRSWLLGRQKNRADHYNLEILELIAEVDHVTTLEELQVIRQKLFAILKEVVLDLDIDRISPESFQSFTFPWEVAITTIRHQEMVVLSLAESPNPPQTAAKAVTKIHIPQ